MPIEDDLRKFDAPPTCRFAKDLILAVGAIVWEADVTSLRYAFIDERIEECLGYPCSHWLNDADFWGDHLHPEDRSTALAKRTQAAASKTGYACEYRMIASDGRDVWIRDVVTFHEGPNGLATLRGAMIDVTEGRAQSIVRTAELYAALSHINHAIVSVRTREDLFSAVCRTLVDFGPFSMAWIGWNDPDHATVNVLSHSGDVDDYLRDVRVRSDDSPEGRGPVGTAIRTGQPCVVNDFLKSSDTRPWHTAAARTGFNACAAFPIRLGDRVSGALAVYATETGFFGSREIALLDETAANISFTLEQFEAEARRRQTEYALRESERRFRVMFERTADALLLLDPGAGKFVDCNWAAEQMFGIDRAQILASHPAQLSPERQPDGRSSAEKAEDMIATALRHGSHRFEWDHRSANRDDFPVEVLLTPIPMGEHQWIITTLRDISARKGDERRQAALYRISEATQAAATLPELFGRLHAIIGEFLPARNFFLALYDADKDELTFPYFVDEVDSAVVPMKLGTGTLSGEVIQTGQSLLIGPEAQQRRIAEGKPVIGAESLDWLGVPLKSRIRTIGALVVQSYSGNVRYSERDKELLEFVSGQVAAAIVRKQGEEALRVSETRFRLLFEQNQAGVFRSRFDGQVLACNAAFAHILGYASTAEILRVNARALYIDAADRERHLSELDARGSVTNAVVRLRRKDGGEVWVMETVNLIDDENEMGIIQGTLIDCTDRMRAEKALRLSESRLEEAQRLAHLGSWNWDLASSTLSWSDELCRIYGLDPAVHFPGFKDFLGRVHPDDRAPVQAVVDQALKEGKPFSHELRIVRPDGTVRTLFDQGEVLTAEFGHVVGLAGACLDITARKLEEVLDEDRSLILEQVAQNKPLAEILARIVSMLEGQLPRSRGSVVLVSNGRLHTATAPNLPAAYTRLLEGLEIGPCAGACGTACHTGQTVVTEDIATDPLWADYRHLAAPHGLHACWSVPIPASGGGVLGALAIYPDHPSRPEPHDLELLGTASRLAAVAIEHRLLTDQLAHQAQHDALTGLPNRLLFQDRLGQALARAKRKGHQVAVLYMDLDRFKQINDTLGHSAGDALLREAATRLGECIREADTLARLGGDEFVVLVTELADSSNAMRVATGLIDALRIPFRIEGHQLFISASLGISVYPVDALDGETLLAHADAAMYRAKDKGRDNFQWFAPEMNTIARERMELEGDLRQAMSLGQLDLHYQPQCGAGGELQAVEALMRWQHPALGVVSPARFIPVAEDSGLIVPMGEWALREACAQLVQWRKSHPSLRVAVNVSAIQFKRANWVETVRRALRDTGLDPGALELEITESLLLQSGTETSANLVELRTLGVGIAIDDFGTGYSSLSYLHKLPVTTLKIDQSFVREVGMATAEGQEEAPIIRTIIALGHNFGMAVVAEGVETEAQKDLLLRLGCDSLQGYLLYRPLTVEQVNLLLRTPIGGRQARD